MADNSSDWMSFAQRSRDDGGLGLQSHQAAGLVGNLQAESGAGLPSWGPTGDAGSVWGTAQWRGDRLDALKAHAAETGLDYKTPEAQQAFMRREFDGTESKSYRALQSAKTPEEAATAVNTLYERSADRTGNRERSARQLYDGTDGPTAIEQAMGRKPATGSQSMAYADTPPALSPQVAPGALQNGGQPIAPNMWDKFGQMLQDMAPGIAQDPAHAQVLEAAAAASRPQKAAAGTWSQSIDPKTGVGTMLHSTTGQRMTFQAHAPQPDDKWGVIKAADPALGTPAEYGYKPDKETWDAQQAAAAATPPKPVSKLLGDESKTGDDYVKTLDPGDMRIIDSWHTGTGIIPSSRDADQNPKTMKLIASAMKIYPDMDMTRLNDRKVLANELAKSSPSSNGGQIANSNTAISILNDAADKHIKLGNSGDVMGSTYLGNAKNWMSNKGKDSTRADTLTGLAANADDASGEITKVITGSGGGVEERKTRSERIGSSTYTPKEAAGALEAEMRDLESKHIQLVDKVRTTMGQTYLDRHPEIEKTFDDHKTKLVAKLEQLRGGGDTAAKPSTGSFKDVPWSFK